jgi:uncharacterized protein
MLRILKIFVTAAFLFFCSFARAEEAPIPPMPSRWVTDTVGFLSPETQQALDKRLEQYEKTSGVKVALYIGTTAGDGQLETWASNAIKTWSERNKAYGQGVVMFLLTQDHAIDVEVAPVLEKRLSDEFVGQVIFEQMAPRLDKNDANGALTAGMDALIAKLEETKSQVGPRETAPQTKQPTPQSSASTKKPTEDKPQTQKTPDETTPPSTSSRPSIYLLVALGALILMSTVAVGAIGWPRKSK